MPFDYPEENQDKNAAPETELEPDYPGGGPRLATNMSAGILPVGNPTRILLPGARTAMWQAQSQESPSQPALGIGHRIVTMGQEQASPLGGAFSLGKGMRPPQREEIGYRILGIPGQPQSVPNLKSSGVPRPEPLVYPNSAGAGLNGAQQSQGIFSSFVPAGASASGDESTRASQTAFARGQQTPIGAPQTGQSSEPQVIPVKKTPSKIQQGTVPEIKPNYKVIGKVDQAGIKKRLGQLTRGLDNPALTPMGIAPDGAPMIDIRYMTKMPSRIFPRAQGDNFIYGDQVQPEFLTKVKQISSELGIEPNWLMAVMAFESGGTFESGVRNKAGSSGTGLLQFTNKTGYDLKALAKMKPEDQLDYVQKYLQPYSAKLNSLSDLYMAVLWPQAVGKPDGYVLFKSPSIEYKQNRDLDRGRKGEVTKADAAAAVRKFIAKDLRGA